LTTTQPTFLERLSRSELVEPGRLAEYLESRPQPLPDDARAAAEELVRDGLITHFQAEQLAQGRYKNFVVHGKYKVLELIGAGGMGRVFLCEHTVLRRPVAVKIIPRDKLKEPGTLERFFREARAVAALDDPNIVRVYDVEPDDRLPTMVMEYVDGTNLEALVRQHGPLPAVRAAHYVSQAAMGLQHAHEAGFVHRDIKPANLLLDRGGLLKILDLGLAKPAVGAGEGITARFDENAVLGTADYLAPEQATNSAAIDIRADVYSLGATLYFLLTGAAPFAHGSVAQKLVWHQMKMPEPPAGAPEGLSAVVMKMLAKKPEERYQTPLEVVQALSEWTKEPVAPPSPAEMPRMCRAVQAVLGVRTPTSVDGPASTLSVSSPTSTSMAHARIVLASAGLAPSGPLPVSKKRRKPWLIGGAAALVLVGVVVAVANPFGDKPVPQTPVAPDKTAPAPVAPDGPITPEEAAKYVGQTCLVETPVRSTGVSTTGSLFFINSKPNHRDPANFAIVLDKEAVAKLPGDAAQKPADHFEGRTIRVRGKVTIYSEKPQIIVNDPAAQIEFVP
jgi:serine/threonine protein kinase